jgi:hypothetical protein
MNHNIVIDRVKRRKPLKNIPKHALCLHQGTKVIQQNNWQSNSLFLLNTKCYVWANPMQHITEYHSHIFKHSGGCIMSWAVATCHSGQVGNIILALIRVTYQFAKIQTWSLFCFTE